MIVRSLAPTREFVCFHGVPWETYEAILGAIGRYHLRHVYNRGAFELRSLLCGVSWEDYEKLLVATGNMRFPHTYDRGWLEIMSPLKVHDWEKKIISRMIEAMCLDLDILLHGIGSTTIYSKRAERGFEPDESYYVANQARVQSKSVFEPDVDPPPDVILEVDITSKSVDRVEAYAATRIPEWWRFDGGQLSFHELGNKGKYKETKVSKAFPFLSPADLQQFIDQCGTKSDNVLIKKFVAHARRLFKEHSNRSKKPRGGNG